MGNETALKKLTDKHQP